MGGGLLKSNKINYLAIIFVNLAVWLPSLFIRFFNDDHQVVLWINPESLADVFSPLWEQYIIGFYWRPLPAILNTSAIFFFGANPFVFHLLSLVIYVIVCILLYKLLEKLDLSPETSLVSVLLFSVLPAHEMPVAWLSARNDTIALAFILFSLIIFIKLRDSSSIKTRGLITVLMTLAFISKEASFPLILLFPAYYIIILKKSLRDVKTFRELLTGLAVIAIIMLYRHLAMGGPALFSSSNLDSFNIITSAVNFVAYIPLSFLDAGTLEVIFAAVKDSILVGVLLAIVLISFGYLLYRGRHIFKNPIVIFGFAWFLAFSLPVLPLLGRWYAFIPSVGLIIAASVFYEKSQSVLLKRVITITIILASAAFSFNRMADWARVSEKAEEACQAFADHEYKDIDTITLLGAPNKIDGINSMRIGVQETVHYYTGELLTDVQYPLKTEIYKGCRIYLDTADGFYRLKASNCRFLAPGSKSSAIPVNEVINFSDDNIEIEIANTKNGISTAKFRFRNGSPNKGYIFWFDGIKFRKI